MWKSNMVKKLANGVLLALVRRICTAETCNSGGTRRKPQDHHSQHMEPSEKHIAHGSDMFL
jgi:hypothetical protein